MGQHMCNIFQVFLGRENWFRQGAENRKNRANAVSRQWFTTRISRLRESVDPTKCGTSVKFQFSPFTQQGGIQFLKRAKLCSPPSEANNVPAESTHEETGVRVIFLVSSIFCTKKIFNFQSWCFVVFTFSSIFFVLGEEWEGVLLWFFFYKMWFLKHR